MSWLKLDDRFPQDSKVLKLPRNDRWTWLEILAYCSRQNEDVIPAAIRDVVPMATKRFLGLCEEAGLLDRNGDGSLHVHGWNVYNGGTVAERVSAYLAQHPDATDNEIVRKVGGNRQEVLKEIKRQREGGT